MVIISSSNVIHHIITLLVIVVYYVICHYITILIITGIKEVTISGSPVLPTTASAVVAVWGSKHDI